jgi:hypothetical protein
MRCSGFLLGLLLLSITLPAQRLHVGLFGGLSAYNGDLTDRILPKNETKGALGITLNYELTDHWMLRGGFTYASVGGADRYGHDPVLVARNLDFSTRIAEFSAIGEYYFFNLYDHRYSPYIFGGLAIFHYNPYTYFNGNKVYLKPLSTEGEGLAAYPQRRPYPLTQPALPFGAGIKLVLSDRVRVGIEVGVRKLFTDYLDDVSTVYADPADLLAAKGQMSVDLSYRGDELPGGSQAYPTKGNTRGGDRYKDTYYFSGIHLTYRLGSSSNLRLWGGRNRRLDCPYVPL